MIFKTLNRIEFVKSIDKLVLLHNRCFSMPKSRKYFEWMYLNNTSNEFLSAVAINDNDEIVAFHGLVPVYLCNKRNPVKCALSLNAMADSAYAGKGLWSKIARDLFNNCERSNIDFIYGFPNYITNRVHNTKLGWKTIYEIPTLELEISDFWHRGDSQLQTDNNFSANYENILNENKGIYVEKTSEYLKWRYYLNPMHEYMNFIINRGGKVSSYIIIKEYEDRVNIVDIFFENIEDAYELIENVLAFGLKREKRYITIWSQINTDLHNLLEKYKFRNKYPITYFGGRIINNDSRHLDFYNYNNWTLNLGDYNVY